VALLRLLHKNYKLLHMAKRSETMSNFVARGASTRQAVIRNTAARAGLLEGESQRIAGRMRTALIKAAKERSGITSDTELLEYALSRVALEDTFAETLTSLRGSVSPDLDLEF
jgi:hypothetical protein